MADENRIQVEVVTDERADLTIAREVSRDGSDTRRALNGWALTSGVAFGGGGSGGVVVGTSPVKLVDLGDGTATIEVVTAGAQIVENGDGTIDLIIGGEQE